MAVENKNVRFYKIMLTLFTKGQAATAAWKAGKVAGDEVWRRQQHRAILGWRYRALEERPKGAAGSWEGGEHGDVLRRKPGWLWRRRPWQRRAADAGVPPRL